MALIKTPDQRVRVFISSTINELAEERQAAREGTSEVQRNEIRKLIPTDQGEGKKWYEEGRKIKIEKAVVYAMADN